MALFAYAEYQARIERVRARMQARAIDVLVVCNPSNMCYLTGYDSWSFYVPQCVLLASDAGQPIWIGREMDANGARYTTFLDAENIRSYGDEYVQSATLHPMSFVAGSLREGGWERAVIGVEMDSSYYSAASHETLRRELPGATFEDAAGLVNWVRVIKSEAEIECMRQAARIAELAMRAAIDSIEPGVRQCDAAAAIYKAQIEGTEAFGGDYPAIVPMMPTGIGTGAPHLTWTDRAFQDGETTIIELAGCRHRYHCPMARTVHLGDAPRRLTDTAKVVLEGLEAALAFARPGVTSEEVEEAWRDVAGRHGLFKGSRIGYSTGLSYPPDWGDHTVSLRPGDRTVLQPNMTLHLILGIWKDDWGIEISECFRVTETGSEPFCRFPRELVLKP